LIVRLGRENANWGYMRMQGELLKLGVGVSATTVANVLRSSGLGPAPRRIGPTSSEFLRAQAQTLLANGANPALADGYHGDTAEAAASAEDRPDDTVETNDDFLPTGSLEPRAALPVLVRDRLAPPCALTAPQERRRLVPSHQSRARDGPNPAGPSRIPQPVPRSDVIAGRRPPSPNRRDFLQARGPPTPSNHSLLDTNRSTNSPR
jgi:hypothetical protein